MGGFLLGTLFGFIVGVLLLAEIKETICLEKRNSKKELGTTTESCSENERKQQRF